MHIYNVLLNRSFMECLANYKDIIEKYFSVQNTMEFLDSLVFPQSSSCIFNQLNPIFQSLIQNQNNIIIEIDPKKDKVVEFLSTKEIIENADKIKLKFESIYNNKIEYKVLIIEYIKKNKLEKGYLLHFGKNTFVILKDIGNKISQKFASIPITEYKNFKELKTEEEINNSKRTIIDIFNNQLLSHHLHGIGNIYINDQRDFKLNYGKFYINDQKDYTEFNYKYKDNDNEYLYNFICLTDGKILSGNINLQNAFTIGILIKKESTINNANTAKKIKFNLSQLNIVKIPDMEAAIKSLGLLYMTRNIFVNPEIVLENKNAINNIMSLITKYNIYNNYCFNDLKTINDFLYMHKNEIIEFSYNDKNIFVYKGIYENSNAEDGLIESVPYNVLKQLILYIIEQRFIDKKQNKDYEFKDIINKTEIKQLGEKIQNIVTRLLSNDYYIIDIENNIPKINSKKLSLNCSCYISLTTEAYELYLVINKQIYSLHLTNNTLFLVKQNNENISNTISNNIVFERSFNKQYFELKNMIKNF